MSNSAHGHRKAGRRQPAPKREPSLDQALICFLEARGAYQGVRVVLGNAVEGDQGKSPGRTFGELVIYSPGLRSAAAMRKAA
jgi:hypothetical protein